MAQNQGVLLLLLEFSFLISELHSTRRTVGGVLFICEAKCFILLERTFVSFVFIV